MTVVARIMTNQEAVNRNPGDSEGKIKITLGKVEEP